MLCAVTALARLAQNIAGFRAPSPAVSERVGWMHKGLCPGEEEAVGPVNCQWGRQQWGIGPSLPGWMLSLDVKQICQVRGLTHWDPLGSETSGTHPLCWVDSCS